jgi:hypothetical protein
LRTWEKTKETDEDCEEEESGLEVVELYKRGRRKDQKKRRTRRRRFFFWV